MDEFLDEMDDEQVDDLLQPEEGEDKAPQLYEHFRFVADRGQSLLRVDKFLVDRMFGATRNRIQSAADAGCIMANGKPVKSNYRVKPEDVVTIMMTRPPRTFEILPENIPIKIVYEAGGRQTGRVGRTSRTRKLYRNAGECPCLVFERRSYLRSQ